MKKFPFLEIPRVFRKMEEPAPRAEQELDGEAEHIDVSVSDELVMIGTAFLVIVIPCILILLGISLLSMWIFGLL